MATKVKLGSTKRYGPRYGKTNKDKLAKAEMGHNARVKCPYCRKTGVKRISSGIWQCLKCGSKFTGKAYNING